MPEIKVIKFPEGRYEGEVDENDVPHGEGEFEYPGNDDLERQVSHYRVTHVLCKNLPLT